MKPLTGIPAQKARSYASIELEADRVRQQLGYDPAEPIDAWRLFNCGLGDIELQVKGTNVELVEAVVDCRSEGLARWDTENACLELVLSHRTYQLLRSNHVRARYTVLHELGHIVQHTEQIVRLAGLSLMSSLALHRSNVEHPPYLDTEWQANAFASAMLMPARRIKELAERRGNVSAVQVARAFNTSEEAAHYRLTTIGKALRAYK